LCAALEDAVCEPCTAPVAVVIKNLSPMAQAPSAILPWADAAKARRRNPLLTDTGRALTDTGRKRAHAYAPHLYHATFKRRVYLCICV
jgi:hypothetical protein